MKYGNLTQNPMKRSVYLRSTDIEQMNWHRLLWSVPDEWLFHWSNNKSIEIYDKSSNKTGKIERIFVPVLLDLLNYIYFKRKLKNRRMKEHLEKAHRILNRDRHLKKKYMFWKRRIGEIKLKGITIHVDKEPNPLESKFINNKEK